MRVLGNVLIPHYTTTQFRLSGKPRTTSNRNVEMMGKFGEHKRQSWISLVDLLMHLVGREMISINLKTGNGHHQSRTQTQPPDESFCKRQNGILYVFLATGNEL